MGNANQKWVWRFAVLDMSWIVRTANEQEREAQCADFEKDFRILS